MKQLISIYLARFLDIDWLMNACDPRRPGLDPVAVPRGLAPLPSGYSRRVQKTAAITSSIFSTVSPDLLSALAGPRVRLYILCEPTVKGVGDKL